MHSQKHEDLLAKWLDNSLTQSEREAFETLCTQDQAFADQVAAASHLNMMAEDFEQVAVPAWDAGATFVYENKKRWWQWSGLPAMSLATSALAMVMVLSGFQIRSGDGQLTIGFGSGTPDKAEIAALVEEKMNSYQQANQVMFGKYVDAIAAQHKESSAQLTQYLLSSSRQERREDFAELVKFINQQRDDDQRFMARQINHLQQDISTLKGGYGPLDGTTE